MSADKDVKFSLKVMTNKLRTKVLFAEADSGFVDVLISFLTLPLGTIVKVLKKRYGDDKEAAVDIGSLTSLYNGLANLDSVHFWTEGCKEVLLNPRSSFEAKCLNLKIDISESQPTEHFICKTLNCTRTKISCLSVYYDSLMCVICGKTRTREAGEKVAKAAADGGGVFTVNSDSFIISDDLKIFPTTKGFFQTFNILGINDADVGDTMIVNFGFNEIMDLLEGSFTSRTPLSDIIFNKRQVDDFEPEILSHEIVKESTTNSKKMILKVISLKSNNKILFAQAQEDFIDFLCSLMAIPLGGVECLLGGNTCLKSIDNLYMSVADLNSDKYMVTVDISNKLMKPKLRHGYISGNPILPLSEESVSQTYFVHSGCCYNYQASLRSVKFVKGQGKYVRGPRMYNISDDLTVTPFDMFSTISTLKGLKIPMSDVKELELEIGVEEGLSILRACLTSASALTNGLKIDHISGLYTNITEYT
ncbi:hypothetical protein MIMGU_mgv1a021865mg [Erythranthe guttata]|uniref:DUF674 domain-containing protein n=1 Tax=Erythranthe guttata TaxID=4155 RepID=A0A022R334_ERYGU|nr:hypothetical protein MIMGU_mgv1a021865mg [Erythranthe guttata]